MGSEIIKIQPGLDIQVNYLTGIVPSVIEAASIAILGIGTSLVKNGIFATAAIVEAWEETSVKIKFHRERGQYLREYIIPTLALYDAVQFGRDFIYSARWDEDIKRKALADIDAKLEKYRVR